MTVAFVIVSLISIQNVIFVDSYAFERFYNSTEFVNFYRNISLSPGSYNNIFLLNKLFEELDSYNDATDMCTNDLRLFRDSSMNSSEVWPLMMFDASGSFQAGMFQGNLFNLGSWDLCLSVQSPFPTTPCEASIILPFGPAQNASSLPHNVPMIYSLCLPSNCQERDLNKMLAKPFQNRNMKISFQCATEPKASTTYLVIIVTVAVIILVGSSVYDLSSNADQRKLNFWNAFSIQRNWNSLFSTKSSDRNLACLFGLKFITQVSVIWYHLSMQNLSLYQSVINKFELAEALESWQSLYFVALTLAVDTYLVMSGLLVSYTTVGKRDKFNNLFKYYLHRYVRLTPSLLTVILTYILAADYMCFGAQCHNIKTEQNNCFKYWWSNLLYINNYYPNFKETCLFHSWYLALDWQLYLISPIFLYFVTICNNKKTTYSVLGIVFALSFIIPAVNTYIYNLHADEFYLNDKNDLLNYYGKYYTPLETRFGPWIVGFIVGLLLKCNEVQFLQSSAWFKGAGWILFGILMAFCLIFNVPSLRMEENNILINALFNSLKKNCWGLTVGWIVIACFKGFAGPLNSFLSWKQFEVLAKLSYGAYLIHRAVIGLFLFHSRTPIYYSVMNQMVTLTGITVVTFAISVIFYVTVESPFCNIDKLILSAAPVKKSTKDKTDIANKSTESTKSNKLNYPQDI